jgi:hypothetical protein
MRLTLYTYILDQSTIVYSTKTGVGEFQLPHDQISIYSDKAVYFSAETIISLILCILSERTWVLWEMYPNMGCSLNNWLFFYCKPVVKYLVGLVCGNSIRDTSFYTQRSYPTVHTPTWHVCCHANMPIAVDRNRQRQAVCDVWQQQHVNTKLTASPVNCRHPYWRRRSSCCSCSVRLSTLFAFCRTKVGGTVDI